MKAQKQTTIARAVSVSGIGVHSGAPVTAAFFPAPAGAGIQFRRTNVLGGRSRTFRAHVDHVGATELCTVLGDATDGGLSTVEHILAALRGLGIDNALVAIDGPEAPIADGSAAPFVEALDDAGVVTLSAPRRFLKILKPVRIEHGRSWAELLPSENGFQLEVEIDFDSALIGRQALRMDLTPKAFRRDIAFARTFGFLKDVERLWPLGFARGSSLENAIVLSDDRILNPEGLRAADEFVRHKLLDAIGDLALAGLPLQGLYRSYCGGHRVNISAVRALYADPSAWTIVDAVEGVTRPRRPLVPALQPGLAAAEAG